MMRRLFFTLCGIVILDEVFEDSLYGILQTSTNVGNAGIGGGGRRTVGQTRKTQLNEINESSKSGFLEALKNEMVVEDDQRFLIDTFHNYSCFEERGVPYLPTYSYSRSP